jgi:hypothetical protein
MRCGGRRNERDDQGGSARTVQDSLQIVVLPAELFDNQHGDDEKQKMPGRCFSRRQN